MKTLVLLKQLTASLIRFCGLNTIDLTANLIFQFGSKPAYSGTDEE